MARFITLAGLAALFGTACFEENACDRYVEYMCDCHDGEEGYDCDELLRVYADAAPGLQDQCIIDLNDQQDIDDDAGLSCDVDSGL